MQDLIVTTLLALVAISAIMTLALAMVEAGRRGMDPLSVIGLIPYMIPTMLPYTLPTCLLYACTVVYGGLSGNNEILALKAAGIHVMRAVWPGLLLGLALAAGGVALTAEAVPRCNERLQQIILDDLKSAVIAALKNGNNTLRSPKSFTLTVGAVEGSKLIRVNLQRLNADGSVEFTMQASEATLDVGQPEKPGGQPLLLLHVEKADFTRPDGKGSFTMRNETLPCALPDNVLDNAEKKLECMTSAECLERAAKHRLDAAEEEFFQAVTGMGHTLSGRPAQAVEEMFKNRKERQERYSSLRRREREALGEVMMRLNLSGAAFAFVLLGVPLAIMLQRRDPLQTFFVAFVPILVAFYPTMILAFNAFKEGQDPRRLGVSMALMCLPLAALGLGGAVALRRMLRV